MGRGREVEADLLQNNVLADQPATEPVLGSQYIFGKQVVRID